MPSIRTAVLLLLTLLLACHPGESARAQQPRLHVQGRYLKDPRGRAVFLHGANYGQRSKDPPYLSWQMEEHFARMEDWGFNGVRLVLQWAGIEPRPGEIDAAYLDEMERAIRWADQHGIYVLLDMHQDVYSAAVGGNGAPDWATVDDLVEPDEHLSPWWRNYFTTEVLASFKRFFKDEGLQEHYAQAWRAVAERAQAHSNVVGYDLMNEPFSGRALPWIFESGPLSSFYARLAGRIREVDPDAILFMEPVALTANEGLPTAISFPPGPSVYAPHYYDFKLMLGFGYSESGRFLAERGLTFMDHQARRRNAPLFLGELGVGRGDRGGKDAVRDQLALLDRLLACGSMAWEYTPDTGATGPLQPGGMSLIQNGVEHPALPVLVRGYPRAVAGKPHRIKSDPEAGLLEVEWKQPVPGELTELYLPARHFPEFTVTTRSPWKFDAPRRLLRVGSAGTGTQSVTVRRR